MEEGSIVICIDGSPGHIVMTYPVEENLYVIREIKTFMDSNGGNMYQACYVEEIDNRSYACAETSYMEPGYLLRRFREVAPPEENVVEELMEVKILV